MSDNIRRGYADSKYGQIHYRVAGDAGLPAVVLLHQTPSDGSSLEGVMTRLKDDFCVYAPDLPGMGQSAACPAPDSIAVYAEMLNEALRNRGVPKFHLFGHHTGAGVAIQMAVDEPDRILKLALSGPPLLTPEQQAGLRTAVPPIPRRPDGSHMIEMWNRIQKKAPSNPLSLVEREVLLALAMGSRYQAAYAAVADQPVAEQLPHITAETLVFAGTEDSLLGSLESAADLIPNCEKLVVQNGNSYISDMLAPELATILRDFFATGP